MADEFIPITEAQSHDWLDGMDEDDYANNIHDYDPSDVAADYYRAMRTIQHLYKELNRRENASKEERTKDPVSQES